MSFQCNRCSPLDIFTMIFSYLDAEDLCRASMVNREWRALATSDFIWKNLFSKVKFLLPFSMSMRQFIFMHGVKSFDQLAVRVQQFADTVSLSQTGCIVCHFPLNPESGISAHFGYGSYAPQKPPITNLFIFAKKYNGTTIIESFKNKGYINYNRITFINYSMTLSAHMGSMSFDLRLEKLFNARIRILKLRDALEQIELIVQ